MIVKGHSRRLKNKNVKDFYGKPLFLWNLEKVIHVFGKVVVDSDDQAILNQAKELEATTHERRDDLKGNDVPSVPIFQSIMDDFKKYDAFLNVQANSPNAKIEYITRAYNILAYSFSDEILICNRDGSFNGSLWGMSLEKLESYIDFYKVEPDTFIVDESVDIHTQEDFDKALANHVL